MRRNRLFRGMFIPSILCILMMLIAACGGDSASTGSKEPAPDDQQVFRWPIGNEDFSTLDPALVQKATDSTAIQAIFTGLVAFDDNSQVQPQLAKEWKLSDDKLTYTFTLKDGVVFSDGTPLTASDVAWSMDRVLDPKTNSQVANYSILIKGASERIKGEIPTIIGDGIKVIDDKTVAITITTPAAYFLNMLTYDTSKVINRKVVEKYGDKWTDHLNEGVGSGPYVATSYDHTRGLEVSANPKYYGAQPKIKKISYLQSGDTTTTRNSYLSGQFDLAAVPSTTYPDDKTKSDFAEWESLVTSYLKMNYLTKPFDNIKIRQAFYLGLDRDLIAETVLNGITEATNHIVPKGMVGYNENLKDPAGSETANGNAAKAKELLAEGLKEAGLNSVADLPPVTLTIRTGSDGVKNASAAMIDQWKNNLGVTVKIEAIQYGTLVDKQTASKNNPNGLQMWYAGWQADYPDPQDWLSVFFAKGQDNNDNNYGQNNSTNAAAQQAVQESLNQADVESDQAKRLQLYADAEQKIITDAGWIPLWQNKNVYLMSSKLVGWPHSSLGIVPPDDWSRIYMTK